MDSMNLTTIDLNNATTLFPYIYQADNDIVFSVGLSFIILVGFIGNITFIWTVVRMPSLHTSTYIYLTSLACTDLLTLIGTTGLLCCVIFMPLLHSKNVPLLEPVSEMVLWFSFIWSICLVTLVSLERYLAICHPIKHRVLKGTRRTFKLIAVTFLFTLAMFCTIVSHVFGYSSFEFYAEITYVIYVGSFLSCLAYNCYMYIRILRTLKQRRRNRTLQLSPEFERNIQQMAIMIIANGLTFFIFSSIVTAFFISFLFHLFEEKLPIQLLYYNEKIFEYIQLTCIVLNATVNPIIYFITNRRYRGALKTSIMSLYCMKRNKLTNWIQTRTEYMRMRKHTSFILFNTWVIIISWTTPPFMFQLALCARLLIITVSIFHDLATSSLATRDAILNNKGLKLTFFELTLSRPHLSSSQFKDSYVFMTVLLHFCILCLWFLCITVAFFVIAIISLWWIPLLNACKM